MNTRLVHNILNKYYSQTIEESTRDVLFANILTTISNEDLKNNFEEMNEQLEAEWLNQEDIK